MQLPTYSAQDGWVFFILPPPGPGAVTEACGIDVAVSRGGGAVEEAAADVAVDFIAQLGGETEKRGGVLVEEGAGLRC